MILLNTHIVVPDEVHLDDALRGLLGNRDKLLQRVAGIKDIVVQTADAMG